MIQYEEYEEPVSVKVTIPTVTTKPGYSLEKSTLTVNPNYGEKGNRTGTVGYENEAGWLKV